MKTLVLCVGRDDDVGTKTPIKGPLIGRDENLVGATKLGLADPEDSDVNTILTALAMYDERVSLGEDAEIATITGDVRVGPISDRILTQQLERVLEEVKPDRVFLVISLPFSSVSDFVEKSAEYYRGLRRRFAARDFSPIFNLVALIVVLLGISFGIDLARTVNWTDAGASVTQMVVLFLAGSLWW